MTAFPLMAAGGALNTIGSLMGGASANRAARQARDFADRDYLGASGSLGTTLYGSQAAYAPTIRRLLGQAQQRNDPAAAADYAQQLETSLRPTAGSLLGRMESTGSDIIRLQNEDLARFDADTERVTGEYGAARDRYAGEAGRLNTLAAGGEEMAQAEADRGNRMAAGAESLAGLMGAGRDRTIRQDSAKRQKAMDQTSRAQLAASGFGNTTAVNSATNANARTIAESQDRALQASQDARLQSLLQARAQRIAAGQAGSGAVQAARSRRIGVGQDLAGGMYSADTAVAGALTARLGQRTGLRSAQLANEQNLRYLPMQTQLAAEQGPIVNFQHPNVSQYYPGASGGAAALAGVGAAMAQEGSNMAQQNFLQGLLGSGQRANNYFDQFYQPGWGGFAG